MKNNNLRALLKEEYEKSWNYIKECKNYIFFAIGIFVFFALISFIFPVPEIIKQKLIDLIKEINEETKNLSYFGLISYIFVNNFMSSFLSMSLGIVFGIFPLMSSILNGYLVGFVSSSAVSETSFFILWRLLPHGIFELPAIFISLGMGFKLGSVLFYKNRKKKFVEILKNSLKTFFLVIFPLLIIAASIEGTLIYFFS